MILDDKSELKTFL